MKANLSEVSNSVEPSDLINEYLSSSKGKNVSFVPATTEAESWFDAILTVNDFLIDKTAFVKSTEEILFFGSFVYNVLSDDDSKLVVKILKSVTCSKEVGNLPWAIPVTVETPVIVTVVDPTLTTFAKTGSDNVTSLYEIKFPCLIILPGKDVFGLVTVLIPEDCDEIVAIPTLNFVDCTESAENVEADPTNPYTDLISEIPNEVTAIATRPDSIPSKINDSFLRKLPLVSYRVIREFAETASLINPLAPLFAPWTKVGTANVIGSFKVISVIVWISYSEISHSFKLAFDIL